MSRKTRKITLSAIISALTVGVLYVASIWQTGFIGLTALASIFAAAAVIEAGLASGLYVYAVSSALGMLLLPDKAAPLLYTIFFGYYPVVKSLIERGKSVTVMWILKIAVWTAAFAVIVPGIILLGAGAHMPSLAILYPLTTIVFVIFDYGFTKLIRFYVVRVSKYVNKGK
jgi:hypothetical protein